MLFNSAAFLFGFLPVTYGVFWLLRTQRARHFWLAVTGYVFYGFWDWRFCGLMAFSTLVSYLGGPGLLRSSGPGRRTAPFVCVPHRRRPLAARRLQVRRLRLGSMASGSWPSSGVNVGSASRHRPPDRDLVLHVPHDHLHRGRLPGRRSRPTPRPLRVRHATSRSSPSSSPARSCAFGQIEQDLETSAGGPQARWLDRGCLALRHRPREEGPHRRHPRGVSSTRPLRRLDALDRGGLAGARRLRRTSSTSTSPATATWPSGLGYLFGLRAPAELRRALQARRTPPTSGGAGTSRSRRWLRDYLYIPLGRKPRGRSGPTAT